jgi:hypothetical protein
MDKPIITARARKIQKDALENMAAPFLKRTSWCLNLQHAM